MSRAWLHPAPENADTEDIAIALLRLLGCTEEEIASAGSLADCDGDGHMELYLAHARRDRSCRLWLYCNPKKEGGGAGMIIEKADGTFLRPPGVISRQA